jgi:hypothetical protein
MVLSGIADSRDRDEREKYCAKDDSGDRQTATTLTGLPDLAQREEPENHTEDGPDDAQPPDRRAQQRRNGHPIDTDPR